MTSSGRNLYYLPYCVLPVRSRTCEYSFLHSQFFVVEVTKQIEFYALISSDRVLVRTWMNGLDSHEIRYWRILPKIVDAFKFQLKLVKNNGHFRPTAKFLSVGNLEYNWLISYLSERQIFERELSQNIFSQVIRFGRQLYSIYSSMHIFSNLYIQ